MIYLNFQTISRLEGGALNQQKIWGIQLINQKLKLD